ncbi:Anabaena sensory rhodopsin transducer [compost metagenome]
MLNTSENQASVQITVYFEDRDPLHCEAVIVPGQRTKHIRTSSLQQAGEFIPNNVPYAMTVQSNIPVIIQYSRLDATQAANALMTTMGYPIL